MGVTKLTSLTQVALLHHDVMLPANNFSIKMNKFYLIFVPFPIMSSAGTKVADRTKNRKPCEKDVTLTNQVA